MAPLVRRGWSPRGYRPLLSQRGGSWEKVSIIAALVVNPQRNRVHLYFRLYPGSNITSARVGEFLAQLLRQLPGHRNTISRKASWVWFMVCTVSAIWRSVAMRSRVW